MTQQPTLSLVLSPDQLAALRSIALSFGLTIGRGVHADWGSIQKFVEAVADGWLAVSEKPTFVCCRCREVKPLEELREASMKAGGWVCAECFEEMENNNG